MLHSNDVVYSALPWETQSPCSTQPHLDTDIHWNKSAPLSLRLEESVEDKWSAMWREKKELKSKLRAVALVLTTGVSIVCIEVLKSMLKDGHLMKQGSLLTASGGQSLSYSLLNFNTFVRVQKSLATEISILGNFGSCICLDEMWFPVPSPFFE